MDGQDDCYKCKLKLIRKLDILWHNNVSSVQGTCPMFISGIIKTIFYTRFHSRTLYTPQVQIFLKKKTFKKKNNVILHHKFQNKFLKFSTVLYLTKRQKVSIQKEKSGSPSPSAGHL